jgi:predicted nucleic-acid-binding Zn-ribbon protein
MFMLDDLSDFKKIQAIREVGYVWVFMAIIFIVLILYGGFHLISGDLLTQAATLILIVSLWGQKYLQWYPIKKSEADKLYTYIDWFVDVKDVQKECPKESSSTDEPYSEAMQVQDNQLYIYCCSQCMMRYVSHRSSEKCPQCGALNIQ